MLVGKGLDGGILVNINFVNGFGVFYSLFVLLRFFLFYAEWIWLSKFGLCCIIFGFFF